MAVSATHAGTLLIQDERFAGNTLPLSGRHALMPILLGLAIPGVAVAVIAPGLLNNPALIFGFYLMAIFVISSVIFIRSVFNPGSIVEAQFDQRSRTAIFTRLGTFATTTMAVPFNEITKVYIETSYDDDGYKTFMPLIELKNGDTVQLPEGTAQGQIDAIRLILAS